MHVDNDYFSRYPDDELAKMLKRCRRPFWPHGVRCLWYCPAWHDRESVAWYIVMIRKELNSREVIKSVELARRDAALSVPCPACGQPALSRCLRSDNTPANIVHSDRVRAWKEL